VGVGVGSRAGVCARARVALLTQHEKRRHSRLRPMAATYFSTLGLSRKWQDFRKKKYSTLGVYFDFLYSFCPKHLFYEEFSEILS
jgi:hypothetical protein